jgi:hypothetical protein
MYEKLLPLWHAWCQLRINKTKNKNKINEKKLLKSLKIKGENKKRQHTLA